MSGAVSIWAKAAVTAASPPGSGTGVEMNTSGPEPEKAARRAAVTSAAVRPFTSALNRARFSAGLVKTESSSTEAIRAWARLRVRRVAAPAAAASSRARNSPTSTSTSSCRTPKVMAWRRVVSAAVRALRQRRGESSTDSRVMRAEWDWLRRLSDASI